MIKGGECNEILAISNYINDFGKDKDGLLSKAIVMIGRIHANLVKQGKKTEEDVEDFYTQLATQKCFDGEHKGLDDAIKTLKQENDVALYIADKELQQTQAIKKI